MSKSNKTLNLIIGILLIIGMSIVTIKNKIIPIETVQHISVNDWHIIVSIITLISSLAVTATVIVWNQSKNINTTMIIQDATKNIIISILIFGISYALFGKSQIVFSISVIIFNALNDIISTGHTQESKIDAQENIFASVFIMFLILVIAVMISAVIATSMSEEASNKTLFINIVLISSHIEFTLLNIAGIIVTKLELNRIE